MNAVKMTVAEAAKQLNVAPKKLLNELERRTADKGIKWSNESVLPDGLFEQLSKLSSEYVQQTTPPEVAGSMTVAEAREIVAESIEYAFLEIGESNLGAFEYLGQLTAARQIQSLQTGKRSAWSAYYQSEDALLNGCLDQAEKLAKDFLPAAQKVQALKVGMSQTSAATKNRLANMPKLS
jgi:hypothetical protein